MARFAEENAQIAREFLGRDDGILFEDDLMDYPQTQIHDTTSFEQAMIRTFSAILCDQNDEMIQLRQQNNALLSKMISSHAGTRTPVCFGGGIVCRGFLERCTVPVKYILDNDKEKTGSIVHRLPVIHPDSVDDWSELFVIVTCMETDGLEKQLQALGLKKDAGYVLAKEYLGWS